MASESIGHEAFHTGCAYVIDIIRELVLVSGLILQASTTSYPMVAVEQETDELRDFRENWKREVQEKRRLQQTRQDPANPPAAPPEQASTSEASNPLHSSALRSRKDALEVYSKAVTHEQAGELDDALRLYRQAFRMDSNVDRAYHLRERIAARTTLEATALTTTASPLEQNMENRGVVPCPPGVVHVKPPPSVPHHPEGQVSSLLAEILAAFPVSLSFEPEDESVLSFLPRLPDELLVHILSYLSSTAIERFALVSRKARMITVDATIWRSDFLLPSFSNAQVPIIPHHVVGGRCSSHDASLPGHS